MIKEIKIVSKNGNISVCEGEMRVEFREPYRRVIKKRFENLNAEVLKEALEHEEVLKHDDHTIFEDNKSKVSVHSWRYSCSRGFDTHLIVCHKYKSPGIADREISFDLEEIKDTLEFLVNH